MFLDDLESVIPKEDIKNILKDKYEKSVEIDAELISSSRYNVNANANANANTNANAKDHEKNGQYSDDSTHEEDIESDDSIESNDE